MTSQPHNKGSLVRAWPWMTVAIRQWHGNGNLQGPLCWQEARCSQCGGNSSVRSNTIYQVEITLKTECC